MSLTWDYLMNHRDDFIGGDLEEIEGNIILRGPISGIQIKDRTLTISQSWCARLMEGTWYKWHITSGSYALDFCSTPSDIDNGRIFFTTPLGRIVLFPKDGSHLDPRKVTGL